MQFFNTLIYLRFYLFRMFRQNFIEIRTSVLLGLRDFRPNNSTIDIFFP